MKRYVLGCIFFAMFMVGCTDSENKPVDQPTALNDVVQALKREGLKLASIDNLYSESNSRQATFEVGTSKDIIAVYAFDSPGEQEQFGNRIYSELSKAYGSELLGISQGNIRLFLIKNNPQEFDIEYKLNDALGRLEQP